MTDFNLIDQPWIPVLTKSGTLREVGIREVLLDAAEFSRIAAELPTVSVAVQRMLQAVLLRAAGPLPRTEEAKARLWGEWWEAGGLPSDSIENYLDEWHGRFNLFDTQYPFFQIPGLALPSGKGSGLVKLIADVPAGTKFFVTRSGSGLESISLQEAAQWLVHAQAFDCAGIKSGVVGDARVSRGKSYSFGYPAWAGNLGLISLEGSSLAETLLLNLVLPATSAEDTPAWESAPQRIASDAVYPIPTGAAQSWTWPSRMIRLIRDGDRVTDVVLSNGEKLMPQNRFSEEPMTAWRHSEPQTRKFKTDVLMPVQHTLGRASWRGLASLLAESSGEEDRKARPPLVLEWLGLLRHEEVVQAGLLVAMRCTGMFYGSQASTFDQVFDDTVPASVSVLGDKRLRRIAATAPEDARKGVMALRDFARNVALATGDSGDDLTKKLADLESHAYGRLRPQFETWLQALTPSSSLEAATTLWQEQLAATLKQVAHEHARLAPTTASVGRRVSLGNKQVHMDVGLALRWFSGALRRNLPLAHPTLHKEDSTDVTNN